MPRTIANIGAIALSMIVGISAPVAAQDQVRGASPEIDLLYKSNIDPVLYENSLSAIEENLQTYEIQENRSDFHTLYYALAIASDQSIADLCRKFEASEFYHAMPSDTLEGCILRAYEAIRSANEAGLVELSAYEISVLSDEIYSLAPVEENLREDNLTLLSDERAAALYEQGTRSDTIAAALINSGNLCDSTIMRDLKHEGVFEVCFNFKAGMKPLQSDPFVASQPIVKYATEYCLAHEDSIPGERCMGEALDAYAYFGTCVVPVHLLAPGQDSAAADLVLKAGLDYCLDNRPGR